MWTIVRIEDADYDCEERLPGEPERLSVTIQQEDGAVLQFEVAKEWLQMQELEEGDEWLEDVEADDRETMSAANQSEWMENYYCALQEMEEG